MTLSLRAYLTDTTTAMPHGLRDVLARKGVHSLRQLLRTDVAASTVSWLGGGPPVTVLDDGGVQEKVTIVVFADGYARASQLDFTKDVAKLFVTGLFGVDFYKANRPNFRVVQLGLVSADDTISAPTTPRDTAIGLVFDATDFNNAGFQSYTDDTFRRIAKALRVWRLDGDIVAVQAHATGNWGKWVSRMMAVTTDVAATVIAHELGHCFGLGDEYVGPKQTMTYTGGEPGDPNLTIETDRTKVKWGSLIAANTPVPTTSTPAGWVSDRDVGLFQGGLRRFPKGVYRPSDDCRMNHDATPFCRVCADTVTAALRYAIEHQGTPGGGGVPGASDHVAVTVRQRADGSQVIVGVTPARAVSLLGPPRPAAEAHVAWLGDDVVAATPACTTGEHDFSGDGPDGEPWHRFADDGSEVFELHVPAERVDELRFGRVALADFVAAASWADAVTHPATRILLEPRRPRWAR
jgi:hypothetical protein